MDKIIDNFWEHSQHTKYDKNCSSCYEARLLNAKRTVCRVDKSCLGTNIYRGREEDFLKSFNSNPSED
jgi:hypothetical protein